MVELAQFGFRSAGELLDVSSPKSPTQKNYLRNLHFNSFSFPEWNPLQLIEKIKNNLPLKREDFLHSKFIQYSFWLERICNEYHTATSKELLAILSRSGRVRVNTYDILL